MIIRLGFAISLSMLVASTQAYAFQESDLTTKAPPCKGRVAGPIKDTRGFKIINHIRWVDVTGDGICDVIQYSGPALNPTIIVDPQGFYINRGGRYDSVLLGGPDIGVLAIYYLESGGAPYLVNQGGRLEKETDIFRWNPKDNNFDNFHGWSKGMKGEDYLAILRFHVHFMVEQAIKEINKGHVGGDVVALYVAMVQISADRSGDQYILEQQEILTNAMIDAANRAEAKKGVASKSKTNAQKVK